MEIGLLTRLRSAQFCNHGVPWAKLARENRLLAVVLFRACSKVHQRINTETCPNSITIAGGGLKGDLVRFTYFDLKNIIRKLKKSERIFSNENEKLSKISRVVWILKDHLSEEHISIPTVYKQYSICKGQVKDKLWITLFCPVLYRVRPPRALLRPATDTFSNWSGLAESAFLTFLSNAQLFFQ